jgi:ABC-type multidrug transport system ATPase subunit
MSTFGMPPNTLRICRLGKSYGRQPVLDGIDLTATGGSILAVTGGNGSGKSTLLRCVAGLASHQGTVTFRGEPVASMRTHIGYLPQTVGLPPWATVGEVISFFAGLRRADPTVLPLPDGFVPEPDRQVGILSGGQRQRVALAVSLLGNPSLLLLDEPAANLDDAARSTLARALEAAAHDGRTVVIATPIETDLGSLEHTVVTIVDGRIEEGSTPGAAECHHNGKAPADAASGVRP